MFGTHHTRLNVDSDFWTSINDLKNALGPIKITSCVQQTEQLYPRNCILEWKKCIIRIRKISDQRYIHY